MKPRRIGLVAQVTEGLRGYIAAQHRSGDLLMPEADLAVRLGVSRATLREALSALWHEGLLVKKWGVGTVVRLPGERARPGEHLSLPLLYIMSAAEMIRSSGAVPGVSFSSVEPAVADTLTAAALDLAVGDPIWVVDRVLTADDEPAFRVRDTLAQKINGKRLDATQFDALNRTLITLLKTMTSSEFQSSDGTIEAVSADDFAARLLRIAVGTPLILTEVISYDSRGRPLTLSAVWFRSDRIKLRFHRKQPIGFRADTPVPGPADAGTSASTAHAAIEALARDLAAKS
jgi:GntR family transcriptional regulator